jgi:hypothetical protein
MFTRAGGTQLLCVFSTVRSTAVHYMFSRVNSTAVLYMFSTFSSTAMLYIFSTVSSIQVLSKFSIVSNTPELCIFITFSVRQYCIISISACSEMQLWTDCMTCNFLRSFAKNRYLQCSINLRSSVITILKSSGLKQIPVRTPEISKLKQIF